MKRRSALPWAAAFAVITVLLAACGGGGDEPTSVDAAGFQAAYEQLGTMIDRAQAGNVDGAEESFDRIHRFAHLVDTALLDVPDAEPVRLEFGDAVLGIEGELDEARSPDALAVLAEEARRTLIDAADALGIEQPGEP